MPDFVIKLRRSGTTGNTPDVNDLQLGELAVNTYDGKLFLKKDDGTPSVIEVGLGCDLTWTASTRTISSSSGNNAVITNVTTSNSGLMSSTDKSKLDGIAAGAEVNIGTGLSYVANSREIQSSTGGNATLPEVVAGSTSGLMTGSDKTKLDGIATGAETNVGTDLTYTSATRSLNSSTGSNVALPLVGAGGTAGLMSGTDKTKLDSIQSNAEINVKADFNATSGDAQILNKPTIPSNLGDLSNVDSTTPTDGQVLTWDDTNSYWEAADAVANSSNADTVDNLHASSFLRSDTSDSMTGSLTVSGSVSADGTISTSGQNTINEASTLKFSQETTTLSQIRAYGSNASTFGSLEFKVGPSTGAPHTPLTLTSTGAATFAGDVNIGNSSKNAQLAVGGVYNQVGLAVSAGGAGYSNCAEFYNSSNTLAASIGGDGAASFAGNVSGVAFAASSNVQLTRATGAQVTMGGSDTYAVWAKNDAFVLKYDGSATFAGNIDSGTINGGATNVSGTRLYSSGSILFQQPSGSTNTVLEAYAGAVSSPTVNITAAGAATFAGLAHITKSTDEKIRLSGSTNPYIRFQSGTTNAAYLQSGPSDIWLWHSVTNEGIRIDTNGFAYYNNGSYRTIWHSGNDGSGSGLDADILDGQQGSYYLDYNNFTNVPVGSGGTDADTVDGLHASSFVRSDQSDTMSGTLTVTALDAGGKTNNRGVVAGNIKVGYLALYNSIDINDSTSLLYLNPTAAAGVNFNYNNTGSVTVGSALNTVWHAGNDGSGSGLDADTCDGQHLGTSANVTFENIYSGAWFRNNSAGEGLYNQNTTKHFYSAGITYWHIDSGAGLVFYDQYNASQGGSTGRKGYVYFDSSGFGLLSNDGSWAYRHNNTYADIYGTIRHEGTNTVWHAGNDGSGSGLDADTLDGLHASSFLRDNAVNIITTSADEKIRLSGSANPYIRFQNGTTNTAYLQSGASNIYLWHSILGEGIRIDTNGLKYYDGSYQTIWHAGNDGSGSGLDADTVDGIQGANFLRSDQSDTMTGNLTVSRLFLGGSSNGGFDYNSTANTLEILTTNGGTHSEFNANAFVPSSNGGKNLGANALRWGTVHAQAVKIDGDTAWHAGNDGAGSGLDADLLDGLQGSVYMNKGSSSSYYQPDNWIDFNTTNVGLYWAGSSSAGWHIYPASGATMRFRTAENTCGLRLETNNGTTRGFVYANNGSQIGFLNETGNWRLMVPSSGSLLRDGNQTIWDSGNDGSGSGLDADTVDGVHASSFIQTDSSGNLLLADGKAIFMSGFTNTNTFNIASLFVDAIKCGNLRIHDGRETTAGSGLMHNTIIGNSARTFSTASGDLNTVVGSFAGYDMSTGHENTLIGARAQQAVTTGGYGTYVGVDAGKNKKYGDYCTGIGYRSDFYTAGGSTNNVENYSNTTCLGYDSRPSGSNQVVAGNTNATLHYYGLSNRSDERDKIDIQDEFLGLDFIKKLKPRAYKWDYRDNYFDEVFDEVENPDNPGQFDKEARLVPVPKDGSRSGTRLHHGLIAQEVKEIIDETGVDFAGYQDSKVKDGQDVLSMNYLELIAPMIKAIQEQQVQIDSLSKTIESMK